MALALSFLVSPAAPAPDASALQSGGGACSSDMAALAVAWGKALNSGEGMGALPKVAESGVVKGEYLGVSSSSDVPDCSYLQTVTGDWGSFYTRTDPIGDLGAALAGGNVHLLIYGDSTFHGTRQSIIMAANWTGLAVTSEDILDDLDGCAGTAVVDSIEGGAACGEWPSWQRCSGLLRA